MAFWKREKERRDGEEKKNKAQHGKVRTKNVASHKSLRKASQDSKDRSNKGLVKSLTEKILTDKSRGRKSLIKKSYTDKDEIDQFLMRKPASGKSSGGESESSERLIRASRSSERLVDEGLHGKDRNGKCQNDKDKKKAGKTPMYEYEVFVHTHTRLTPREEIAHFRSKVKDGRAEVIRKKDDYLLKDRRGLCIQINHKSRKFEDVLECVRALLEALDRDPEIDHCRLIRHCPRLPGELD